jgi:hypothetical protein
MTVYVVLGALLVVADVFVVLVVVAGVVCSVRLVVVSAGVT